MNTPSPHRLVIGIAAVACAILPACSSSDDASTTDASTEVTTTRAPASEAPPPTSASEDTTNESAPGTDRNLLGSYTLNDEEFGTMVTVTVEGGMRTIVSNALPDHATGEFPNANNPNTITAQDVSWSYPTEPVFTGEAVPTMVPGVAVNGVKFDPATAESVTCESGERYPVEALQDIYNLGLDFNNAHVQPTGEYHYHGISQLLVDAYATDDDLVLVGFAADGYLMYYSKSGAYAPSFELSTTPRSGTDCVGSTAIAGASFDVEGTAPDGTYGSDWVFNEAAGDLDSCNGTTINGQYAYIVTDTYPYISRCLNGEAATTGGPGGGGAAPEATGAEPDLSAAAEALGVTEEELRDALGGPPPDLEAAAAKLGVTVEELEAVLPRP